MASRTIDRLIVHHSDSPKDTTSRDQIDQWHKERGWSQIGYHQVIEGDGRVVAGRDEATMGAHAGGANRGTLGVCVVGNFEKEIPNPAQINALISLLAQWCKTYRVSYQNIYGHREVGTTTTSCPGKHLFALLPEIREKVRYILQPHIFCLEKLIRDPVIKAKIQKALRDGNISYLEIREILLKIYSDGLSGQEAWDLIMIMNYMPFKEKRAQELIAQFIANPQAAFNILQVEKLIESRIKP